MAKVLLSFCIPTYTRPHRISKIIDKLIQFRSNEIEIININTTFRLNKIYFIS